MVRSQVCSQASAGWRGATALAALRSGLATRWLSFSGEKATKSSSGNGVSGMAAQRIIAGEGDVYIAGGVESISCVQNEANKHMAALDAYQQHPHHKAVAAQLGPLRDTRSVLDYVPEPS